jgi:DNA primase
VYVNGDWVNFSCILAPFTAEHKFKDDGNPSAGISIGKDGKVWYKCFTCKHQGPFSKTIERYEFKSKKELSALKELAEKEEELPDYEYLTFVRERVKPEPLPFTSIFESISEYPEAQKYLADRGISPTTASRIGLEFDPEGHRIVFPVKDKAGVLYGFTGRSTDPTDKKKIKDYHFQKSQFILGLELWKDQPSVIVEGLFAYAHIHEITKGRYFPYNVGAIMGSQISPDQAEILIKHGYPIYCLLDGDKAGITGTTGKKGIIRFTKDEVPTFILRYPEGKTDPDNLTYDELCEMLVKPLLVK